MRRSRTPADSQRGRKRGGLYGAAGSLGATSICTAAALSRATLSRPISSPDGACSYSMARAAIAMRSVRSVSVSRRRPPARLPRAPVTRSSTDGSASTSATTRVTPASLNNSQASAAAPPSAAAPASAARAILRRLFTGSA